ncbi:MAG: ABC transporter ATP-binding protein/permease [Pirellula sp.]|jgi:ATP-binding cassette subfamily B protein/subfamily B ATP-binding cassette protein MsbA|nr:ABC transporter ATP-binding protein/permease [Pirellula sp.]
MKPFWNAIRDSLHHAPALVLATLCSVGIAFLWGSNIGALYPVVEMTLNGESIQSWLEKGAQASDAEAKALESQIAQPNPALSQKDRDLIERKAKQALSTRDYKLGLVAWADRFLPRNPFQTICWIMGLLMVSTLIKHALMLTNDLLIGHVSTSIVRDLRMRVFDSALAMDRKTYQAYGTSGLLAAITAAADGLTAGLIHLFGAAIREPLRIASCLIMASLINWRLLLLSLVLAPALVAIVVFFNRKIRRAAASILGRNAGFHEVLLEALGNIFTVQAFTMEPHERDRFRICTNEMKRVQLKMVFWTGIGKPFTELIGVAMVAITVCAGAYLVVNKQTHLFFLKVCDSPMSVTDLLIFFGLLIGASDPLRKLSGVSVMIYQGMVSSELLYGILNAKPILPVPAEPKTLLGRHHQLSLKNVSFHYHPNQPVLSNVSLEIPFGKTVALLGSNGSGKSTLIQLLCRYYDPVDGSIQLDDVDLRDLALSDIRQRMTLVSQNTELFNRSVFENIKYGSPNATKDEVELAARLAHAHEFITNSLSEGYETIVGQAGQKLSGGQRQRIALARAILRKPEILILDESTSQIDMASELQIRETLQAMKGQMTILIITHREALIALADEVYSMQSGVLVETLHDSARLERSAA